MRRRDRMFYIPLAAMVIVIFLVGEASGVTTWLKEYGTRNSVVNAIRSTTDGGYIAVGNTLTPERSVLWLLKLQADGTVEWSRTYVGKYDLYGIDIDLDGAGGYYVLGKENSTEDFEDLVIMRIDSTGGIEWDETFERSGDDLFTGVYPIPEGGYLLTGWTTFYREGGTDPDAVVLRLDGEGKLQWVKGYGLPKYYDEPNAIEAVPDGGWVIAGTSGRNGWLFALDPSGEMLLATRVHRSTSIGHVRLVLSRG